MLNWFQDEDQKQAENEYKRKQELESEAAKALAEELVMSAGLEMAVVDILNHASKSSGTGSIIWNFYINSHVGNSCLIV